MTENQSPRDIVPEPESAEALESYLKDQEKKENREVVGFKLKETDVPPLKRLKFGNSKITRRRTPWNRFASMESPTT